MHENRREESLRKREDAQIDPRFAPVAEAFAKKLDVSGGMMMSSYGLKVRGKIFAMFGRGKFVAKLPQARVDELVKQRVGEHFDPGHGRLMKEWIAIAGEEGVWISLAKEAYQFVKGKHP